MYRTKFLDYDARREPKTDRYCVRCQKDLKKGAEFRQIHLVDGGAMILHPEDEAIYMSDAGDLGTHLLGMECARIIGMEWSKA